LSYLGRGHGHHGTLQWKFCREIKVPASSSQFQPAPDGGCSWWYSINNHFTEFLWRNETYHFSKYNFSFKGHFLFSLLLTKISPVPAGSSRLQPVPDGGCNWFYSINRYFTECLWRSESCHFKKYNFFVKKTYPLTLLSFSQLRYSLEQWKLDIKWGKRRCLQNSKVVFCNILQVTFS